MRNPTLFEMEKLEDAAKPASELKVERPYPRGMQSRDFLSYYATQFATVEVDSTFYGRRISEIRTKSEACVSMLPDAGDLLHPLP